MDSRKPFALKDPYRIFKVMDEFSKEDRKEMLRRLFKNAELVEILIAIKSNFKDLLTWIEPNDLFESIIEPLGNRLKEVLPNLQSVYAVIEVLPKENWLKTLEQLGDHLVALMPREFLTKLISSLKEEDRKPFATLESKLKPLGNNLTEVTSIFEKNQNPNFQQSVAYEALREKIKEIVKTSTALDFFALMNSMANNVRTALLGDLGKQGLEPFTQDYASFMKLAVYDKKYVYENFKEKLLAFVNGFTFARQIEREFGWIEDIHSPFMQSLFVTGLKKAEDPEEFKNELGLMLHFYPYDDVPMSAIIKKIKDLIVLHCPPNADNAELIAFINKIPEQYRLTIMECFSAQFSQLFATKKDYDALLPLFKTPFVLTYDRNLAALHKMIAAQLPKLFSIKELEALNQKYSLGFVIEQPKGAWARMWNPKTVTLPATSAPQPKAPGFSNP